MFFTSKSWLKWLPKLFMMGSIMLIFGLLFQEHDAYGRRVRTRTKTTFSHGHSHAPTKKNKKKKKKKSANDAHGHSHEDAHGHSHAASSADHSSHGHTHSTSGFTFGAGISYFQTLSGDAVATEGEAGGNHAGHSHGLALLGEGHSHAGGTETGEISTAPEPQFNLMAGYRLNASFSILSSIGFFPSTGITDPAFGGSYSHKLLGSADTISLTATAPVSQTSQDNYKMTTVTGLIAPIWKKRRWLVSPTFSLASSWYSKTVIVAGEGEDEELALNRMKLQEEHDHEEGHVESVSLEMEDTGNREFNRYTGGLNIGYRITRSLTLGVGGSLAYVARQFGDDQYEIIATLAQLAYTWNDVLFSSSFVATSANASPGMPSDLGFSVGLNYIYE